MRTGHISVVRSLAAAVPPIGFNAADRHLDGQHYPYLLCLAFAHSGTAMVSSWLGYAAGVRIGGDSSCNYRFAPDHTSDCTTMLSGTGRLKTTAPPAIPVSGKLYALSNATFISIP
jgi:hypothetical protein